MSQTQRRAMLLLIVLSGVIISICMGLRQSLGLFMQPMTVDSGISAAAFGFSIALQNIVWGLSQPFVGALADRYGARPVLVVTALVYAGGIAADGSLGRFPAALEVAGFLAGVGTAGHRRSACCIGTVSRATPPEKRSQTVGPRRRRRLARHVRHRAARAVADQRLRLAGRADGLRRASRLRWRCLSLPIREPAVAHEDYSPGESSNVGEAVREAMAHRGYLFMTLAFFACGFQLVFITTHLPSYLQICGVAPGVGATALALIGLFNTIGTYMFGLLGARYSQKHLLALIYLLRTLFIAIFLLVPVSAASTLVFAVGDGLPVARRRAAGHRHHRPRVRPHALQHALRRGVPQPPGRLVLRRLDGRPGVRPLRQLRLRLGRADRDRRSPPSRCSG